MATRIATSTSFYKSGRRAHEAPLATDFCNEAEEENQF